MTNYLRTPEERQNVHDRLVQDGNTWASGMPDYLTNSREMSLGKLDNIYKAVDSETDADKSELESAYDQTRKFVHTAFDFFEGNRTLPRTMDRAFVVPMRSNRQDEEYASESIPFVPLLDPNRFGVDSDIRMRAMYGYPPLILDTYMKSSQPNQSGAIVLAPVFEEMKTDFITYAKDEAEQQREAMRTVYATETIMARTAIFAHDRLGANVIGLGAVLPGVTNFGEMLRKVDGMGNLVTTTGHGGTVYTIVETARKVMNETEIQSNGTIGVIGGNGSIGWSSAVATLDMIQDHSVLAYDAKNDLLKAKRTRPENSAYKDQITIAESSREVMENSNIMIAAVTGTIDLDDPAYDGLDLTGKVIIDDSQPACFNRAQVEARGGKVVWVVGADGSQDKFITRDGYHTRGVPYNYGDTSGLWGPSSEFACGQEAAVIAAYGEYDRAITSRVRPHDVKRIGELFVRANVQVAPFQAFGQPVEIK